MADGGRCDSVGALGPIHGGHPNVVGEIILAYLHSPHMDALFFLRFLAYRDVSHRKQKRAM